MSAHVDDPFDRDRAGRLAFELAAALGCPNLPPYDHDPVAWVRLQLANRDRALQLIADLERSEATVEQDVRAAIKMARDALGKGPTL